MYFAGYPQFNQSMPQMSMPVNATNQQGSSVQGANTGMLGNLFGGLGGFGGGFSPSGFSMPQMGYGGMGGYGGGFGGMGGYGGFGGGFGMPQMGYGGYGGFGGFGMPQMGYGLGSFGPQMGFGGYGNYGGFQPPQFATTDVKSPYLQGQPMGPYGDTTNQFTPDWARKYANEGKNPWSGYYSPEDAEIMKRASDAGWSAPQRAAVGDTRWHQTADLEAAKQFLNKQTGANPSTGVMPSEPIPAPGGAYIPDETGQYDPNRGNYGQTLAPTYSEPSAPVAEPLSVANPQRNQEIIGTPIPANSAPINQPRRMRNSMNMGIGSFYGGIGPGNFRNFYTP